MDKVLEELIEEFGLERKVIHDSVRGCYHKLIVVYKLTDSLLDVYDFDLRRFLASSDIEVCKERIVNCLHRMKEREMKYKMESINEDF